MTRATIHGVCIVVIYAANVADTDLATGNDMSDKVKAFAASEGNKCVLVSAQVAL
jgi:hypothetical protein